MTPILDRLEVHFTRLSTRVELLVDFLQPRLVDVRVNLSCCDTRVPQHLLDFAQVRSAREKMRGETVSQGMRADGCGRPRAERVAFDKFPNRLAA
jgi:hypothetical protein